MTTTAHLKNSYKKITKKQAITGLIEGKKIGIFDDGGKDFGFGYIIDDFDEIIENAISKEHLEKIIKLNFNNLITGTDLRKISYYEIIN